MIPDKLELSQCVARQNGHECWLDHLTGLLHNHSERAGSSKTTRCPYHSGKNYASVSESLGACFRLRASISTEASLDWLRSSMIRAD